MCIDKIGLTGIGADSFSEGVAIHESFCRISTNLAKMTTALEEEARESTRLISACAVSGQAAGAFIHYQPIRDKYPGATSLDPSYALRAREEYLDDSIGSPGH